MLAGAAATAALVFPYTSPAALVWAFKKGDDAVLFGSRRFTALVREDAEVAGLLRGQVGVTYYSAEVLKESLTLKTTMDLGTGGGSFRPGGSFLPSASFLPGASFLPSGSFRP